MNDEYTIQLSGPFQMTDSNGRTWNVKSVCIFNEGYGNIDVYVSLASDNDDDMLHEDPAVIRQVLSALRSAGYTGPELRPGEDEHQDSDLVVLKAPEEFEFFAIAKGWKNLANDYPDGEIHNGVAVNNEKIAQAVYSALMQKMCLG